MFALRSLLGIAFWLGLLLAPLAALADPPYGSLYRGHVGAHGIVACIQPEDDEGHYYLVPAPEIIQEARDISRFFKTWGMGRFAPPAEKTATGDLTGTWQLRVDGACCGEDLREPPEGPPHRDQMALTRDGAGGWRGVYRHFGSEDTDSNDTSTVPLNRAPIELRLAAADCSGFENQRLDSWAWDADKPKPVTATPQTRRRPLVLFKAYSMTHPITGVKSVELQSGPHLSTSVADAINEHLEKIADAMNREWTDCEEFEGGIELKFATRHMVVLEASSEVYCGGNHPDDSSNIYSFDLQTGQPIVLNDWLRDGKIPKRLLTKVFKAAASEHDDGDGCLESMRDNTDLFSLWMAPGGMQFRYNEYVHSLLYCRDDYAVPFSVVRPFIDKSHRKTFDAFVRSFH